LSQALSQGGDPESCACPWTRGNQLAARGQGHPYSSRPQVFTGTPETPASKMLWPAAGREPQVAPRRPARTKSFEPGMRAPATSMKSLGTRSTLLLRQQLFLDIPCCLGPAWRSLLIPRPQCCLWIQEEGKEWKGNRDIFALDWTLPPKIGDKCVTYVETVARLSSPRTICQNS
jgi:hypothetical protein